MSQREDKYIADANFLDWRAKGKPDLYNYSLQVHVVSWQELLPLEQH